MEQGYKIQSFKDLHVWQEAHILVLNIYKITKNFPREEMFSLTDQIRRASVSITSNIAEGFGRRTSKDKIHFYVMSAGSLQEVHNQLLLAKDIGYLQNDFLEGCITRIISIQKMLNAIVKKLESF